MTFGLFRERLVRRLRGWGLDRWLLGAACVLVFLLGVQGVRWVVTVSLSRGLAASLRSGATLPQRDVTATFEEYGPILDKGILGARRENKPPPPPQVFGIMGHTALIGTAPDKAKPYEVGGEVPEAGKILRIGATDVVFEKDGKEQTVPVFPDLKSEPAKEEKP